MMTFCLPNQIHVVPFANDAPGMMHSSAYYQVVNVSEHACLLPENVYAWAVLAGNKLLPLTQSNSKDIKNIVAEPMRHDGILAQDLIWFKVSAVGALQAGDKGFTPNFTRLLVTFGQHLHFYTLDYTGYSSAASYTHLYRGVKNLDAKVSCRGNINLVQHTYQLKNLPLNCG